MTGLPSLPGNLHLLASLVPLASLSLAQMIVLRLSKVFTTYWLDNQPALALLDFSLKSEAAHPKLMPESFNWLACMGLLLVQYCEIEHCVGHLNVIHLAVILFKLKLEPTG